MAFDSAAFALFCAIAVLLFNLFRSPGARLTIALALSLTLFASYAPSLRAIAPIMAFMAGGYGAIAVSRRAGGAGFAILLVTVVAVFVWLKQYTIIGFLPALAFPYTLVGMSFILFRIVHLMVDVRQGAQERPSPVHYLAYLIFFPTYVSGPIQRCEEFLEQIRAPHFPRGLKEIEAAFERILLGYFMTAVVTKLTFYLFSHAQAKFFASLAGSHLSGTSILLFGATATAYVWHLYLNFVGYMGIVVGVGRLCGFQVPENFDRPYLAQNFLDLWSRWHITLSSWIKFYIFNPMLTATVSRWGSPKINPYLGVAAFFVSFLIIGLWHGSSMLYLVYGICFGFGVASNKLYQLEATKWLGRDGYRRLCAHKLYRHFARALALGFFVMVISCVWLTPPTGLVLASVRGVAAILISFLLVVAGVFVASVLFDRLARLHAHIIHPIWQVSAVSLRGLVLREKHPAEPHVSMTAPLWMGVKFFAVANLALMVGGTAPEFVYKVF